MEALKMPDGSLVISLSALEGVLLAQGLDEAAFRDMALSIHQRNELASVALQIRKANCGPHFLKQD